MSLIKDIKSSKPDSVEAILVIVLAVWTIVTMWLLERAISFQVQSLITWQALSTFFMAFISILVIVIAVILADMRKEMKGLY
ncbi:MAG: hypothetical protein V1839_01115 [archaeon]